MNKKENFLQGVPDLLIVFCQNYDSRFTNAIFCSDKNFSDSVLFCPFCIRTGFIHLHYSVRQMKKELNELEPNICKAHFENSNQKITNCPPTAMSHWPKEFLTTLHQS